MKTKVNLSKQVLSIFLCLMVLLAHVPISSYASTENSHNHCVCGGTEVHADCEPVTWTAWDGTTPFPGGNVYLSGNAIFSSSINIAGTVNLCLNGHTITAAGGYFDIAGSGTLNLCSCEDNGIIKRTTTIDNALICADARATVNIYNITLDGGAVWSGTEDTTLLRGTSNSGVVSGSPLIDAGYQKESGGHITLHQGVVLQNNSCSNGGDGGALTIGEDGTLVINGAIIRDNNKTTGQAGAIKAYSGAQITMNDGEIYGNSAYTHGGAIQIFGNDSTDHEYAVFTMNGGTIRNNKAGGVGGGIAVSDYSSFIMNGGSITGNNTTDYSKRGGGVGFADADTAMSVSGNAVITGNSANNLYIGTKSCNKVTVGAMERNAHIGITMYSSSGGVFSNGGADYADKFTSDNSAYVVAVDGDNLKLALHTHSCIYTVNDENSAQLIESCTCGHTATATLSVDNEQYTYTGSEITPATITYSNGWQGSKPTEIRYSNNTNASTNESLAKAIITIENKELSTTFRIHPVSIADTVVTLMPENGTYTGLAYEPSISVIWNGVPLAQDTDYVVSWDKDEFKTPDTYTARVVCVGNFTGYMDKTFKINAATLTDVKVEQTGLLTYHDGEVLTPAVSTNAVTVNNQPITFVYSTLEDGTYGSMPCFTEAGTYTVYYKASAPNHNEVTGSFAVTVDKADQTAPAGVDKTNETISAKNDGKITGVNSTMEYRRDGESTYTAITGTELTNLADGTYFVRYKETENYNASSETEIAIAAGRKLTVTLPKNQVGYKLTTTTAEMDWYGELNVEFELLNGYSMLDHFEIYNNGYEPMWQHFNPQTGVLQLTFVGSDFNFTVQGVADITAPVAEIHLKDNRWTQFWNNITFGLFFKETQDVTITAADNGSGIKNIQYFLAGRELERDEVRSITDWMDYNGTFQVNPDNKYVVYAKITDHDGNVEYINSEGIILDATAPVFYGIENGGVYHGDKVFKAMDENFLKIEVDGVDITDTTEGDAEFKIVADNAEHTVTVTDKAGNVTEYKITVYKKYMVTYTDGDGGSYEKEFKYGEVITIPTNEIFKDTFRKTGHAIKEWQGYTEGMTMPLQDLTFTAVYVPCEYIVSFEQNGGEAISPITVTFGEKYGNLPSSAIMGLSGGNKNWYLVDADGNVTDTNIKNLTLVSTARDHQLFVKRSVLAPSVSVALTVPGGISDSYQYYIPGASQRILTADVGNRNADILDYTYQWYKDGTAIAGATSNVLTLDGNVSDSGTYKVEVTATLKGGTNIVVTSDAATASKEQKVKILHATNTLSYDANGGEGGPQSSYSGGTALNVSKDVPTREHYDFISWNTASDGTGDSYKTEDVYTFINDNGNGGCEVTLYAQWKLVEYTVTYMADDRPAATEKVEHGKDATLTAVPAKDGYVGKWDSDGKNITGDTIISAVYTAIPVVKQNEVKPKDKTNLEDVKAKLEEELKDDSYTDDDKKDIQDAIDDINDALEVIGNVEAVEKLIDKLPDTIRKNDEPAIKAADDAYNALTDYEKSLVSADMRKALADAKEVLAALKNPAELHSPQTGHDSAFCLWFALLFISGMGVFGITLYECRKIRK